MAATLSSIAIIGRLDINQMFDDCDRKTIVGTVTKVSRKCIKVRSTVSGTTWKVSPCNLVLIEDDE